MEQGNKIDEMTLTIGGLNSGVVIAEEEKTAAENELIIVNEALTQALNELTQNDEAKVEEIDETSSETGECFIIDAASIEELKQIGIENQNVLINDLLLHPELIPYEGTLGGNMNFTEAFVLNNKWVYARFEDGHVQGFSLYEFWVEDDLSIEWELIDAQILE
jgi:hypothetical protein